MLRETGRGIDGPNGEKNNDNKDERGGRLAQEIPFHSTFQSSVGSVG
jgi:hypothetical protein